MSINDENLNQILKSRIVPPPSSNLSARIIARAEMNKKSGNAVPLYQVMIGEILAMVMMPRPAYALAFFLLFGVAVGVGMDLDTLTTTEDYFSFASVMDTDIENWL